MADSSQLIEPQLFAFFFDNLLMMLQFSYSCEYYQERMQIFCGEAALEDTKMADRLTRFLLGAMKGDVCSISSGYDSRNNRSQDLPVRAEQDIRLIASAYAGYGLYILPDGGAEQDADEWWDAMCRTTKAVFEKTDVTPAQVTGISFVRRCRAWCSWMKWPRCADELYGPAGWRNSKPARRTGRAFPA